MMGSRHGLTDRSEDCPATSLESQVGRVNAIRLVGVPVSLVLDQVALLTADGEVPEALVAKLRCLVEYESISLVLVFSKAALVPVSLSSLPDVSVQPRLPESLGSRAIVIAGTPQKVNDETHAWYVGPGKPAKGMRPCREAGPLGTDLILRLFGTGLVQERAGVAFRAAGAGHTLPSEHPYDRCRILDGLSLAVAPPTADSENDPAEPELSTDLDTIRDDRLVSGVLDAVELACAPNGAIAGAPAPAGPDDPDYWFFWPRDAGQVAIALAGGMDSCRTGVLADRMKRVVDGYVDFVSSAPMVSHSPNDLTVSRFTMTGAPVVGYGNPQNDGPAYTALALLTAVGDGDPRRALELARPHLDVLVRLASGSATFDCWEFTVGRIFATDNLVRRALRRAEKTAALVRDESLADRCGGAAADLERHLVTCYDESRGYLAAGQGHLIPWLAQTSNLDSSVIGSALVAYDVSDNFMNVDDWRMMNTMKALEVAFSDRWPVNRQWAASGRAGMGFGRFPEDTNDGIGSTGGNPWVITTLWAAHYYLRLIQRLAHLGVGRHGELSPERLLAKADGMLEFVLAHVDPSTLGEQVDGQTGRPRGAEKLAWALAELLTVAFTRDAVKKAVRLG